jgi:hypothetical protein
MLTHIQQYNNCFQMTSFGATKFIQENVMPTFKIQGQIYHLTVPYCQHRIVAANFCKFILRAIQQDKSIMRVDNLSVTPSDGEYTPRVWKTYLLN